MEKIKKKITGMTEDKMSTKSLCPWTSVSEQCCWTAGSVHLVWLGGQLSLTRMTRNNLYWRLILHWNVSSSEVNTFFFKKWNSEYYSSTILHRSCQLVHSYGRLERSYWFRLLGLKSIRYFKTSGTIDQSPGHNIQEDLNFHQRRSENLRFRNEPQDAKT